MEGLCAVEESESESLELESESASAAVEEWMEGMRLRVFGLALGGTEGVEEVVGSAVPTVGSLLFEEGVLDLAWCAGVGVDLSDQDAVAALVSVFPGRWGDDLVARVYSRVVVGLGRQVGGPGGMDEEEEEGLMGVVDQVLGWAVERTEELNTRMRDVVYGDGEGGSDDEEGDDGGYLAGIRMSMGYVAQVVLDVVDSVPAESMGVERVKALVQGVLEPVGEEVPLAGIEAKWVDVGSRVVRVWGQELPEEALGVIMSSVLARMVGVVGVDLVSWPDLRRSTFGLASSLASESLLLCDEESVAVLTELGLWGIKHDTNVEYVVSGLDILHAVLVSLASGFGPTSSMMGYFADAFWDRVWNDVLVSFLEVEGEGMLAGVGLIVEVMTGVAGSLEVGSDGSGVLFQPGSLSRSMVDGFMEGVQSELGGYLGEGGVEGVEGRVMGLFDDGVGVGDGLRGVWEGVKLRCYKTDIAPPERSVA